MADVAHRMAGAARRRLLCVMQLPPPVHGVSVVNEQVMHSERLASRFSIDVVPLRFSDSLADMAKFSPIKAVRVVTTGVRLVNALLRHRPDAVYFTLSPAGGAFLRDCLYIGILKAAGVRRVYHLHGKGISSHADSWWRSRLCRWVFCGARVIHLSPLLAHDVSGFVRDEYLHFVPNGVPEPYGPPPIRHARQGAPRVLFLSNMVREKGVLVLLEALAALRDRGIPFSATFAGARTGDGCVEEFETAVVSKSLADQVRWVGPVYSLDKETIFREHDVFAFPSYNDAFPLVLLEAMLQGLPIVTTAVGASAEIVEHGKTGFVVPERDPDALADALQSMLLDHEGRRRMGEAGRKRGMEKYTLRAFERKLSEILEVCLEK